MSLEKIVPKSVDNPSYHIWTDALHARSLARQTEDQWDRGAYVRWTIISAWTAFEAACEDALGERHLGGSFKRNFDKAINKLGLPRIDWGKGVWQQVLEINELRIDYVHLRLPQARQFPAITEGEKAIQVLREGVREIHKHVGKPSPAWVEADNISGWKRKGDARLSAHAAVIHGGVRENHPEVIKIAYVYQGREHVTEIWPPGTDPHLILEKVESEIVLPITSLRIYKGSVLIEEIPTPMQRC